MPSLEAAHPVSTDVLPYADLPARWGVVLIRSDDRLRIVVPPVPNWKLLGKAFYIPIAILTTMLAFMTFATIQRRDPGGVAAIISYAIPLFSLILVATHRLCRRLVLEIGPSEVSVSNLGSWLSTSRRAWPRGAIGEIKFNASNQCLMIRVSGQDLTDIYVSPHPEVTRWVAEQLDHALRQPLLGPQPVLPMVHDPAHGARTRLSRNILVAVALAMLSVGIGLQFLGFPWAVLGIYLLIFSAAPIGIALGTQKKDYYFL